MSDETGGPIVVLALNYQEATVWARERRLGPREWVFAAEPHHVLGRRSFRYVVLPRFWSRDGAHELATIVSRHGGREVELGPSPRS